MNQIALKKHDIYDKLIEFTDQELNDILVFIDFIRYKNQLEDKHIIQLEGMLRGYEIDFSDLHTFKQTTWTHVDEESMNE